MPHHDDRLQGTVTALPPGAETGIILFAHGSRDPNWRQPFEAILSQIQAQHSGPVALAFLECMKPGLPDAIETMVAGGVKLIRIIPAFLAVGAHVRKDLPALMDAARLRHPRIQLCVSPAIGESTAIQQAIASFALAAPSLQDVAPGVELG